MKLIDHRRNLNSNPDAYEFDFRDDRLIKTFKRHLQKAGFKIRQDHNEIIRKIINLLFDAQGRKPIFHIEESELPLCWNSPKDWDKNYIKYEWGHMRSLNQNNNEEANDLKNYALYSARCNNHLQASMDIEELKVYGGKLQMRIDDVLEKRKELFNSDRWKELVIMLSKEQEDEFL